MLRTYKRWVVCLTICLGIGALNEASAQVTSSDLPDAPSEVTFHPHHGGDPASDRTVSWSSLPKDFLHDQKQIWTFPIQLGKGKHWVPTAAIVGITGVLIATDKYTTPYFRNHQGQWDD